MEEHVHLPDSSSLMKAMILAAEDGECGLLQTCQSPTSSGGSLLEHQIRLKAAGFNEIVINASYLGRRLSISVVTAAVGLIYSGRSY